MTCVSDHRTIDTVQSYKPLRKSSKPRKAGLTCMRHVVGSGFLWMEVEYHVGGLPATSGVLADIDARQLAQDVSLQLGVRRIAFDHLDTAFRIDHETQVDLTGHVRLLHQGKGERVAQRSV